MTLYLLEVGEDGNTAPAVGIEAEGLYPRLYVCPWCTSVWGILNDPSSTEPLGVIGASCARCNEDEYWYPVPGSLLSVKLIPGGFDWDLLNALPPDLVEREFRLHLNAVRGGPDDG